MRAIICAALGLMTVMAAWSQPIEIVTEPEAIAVQATHEWQIAPVETQDRTALLELTARVDAPSPSGSNYLMQVQVNGELVTGAKSRTVERLVNKPMSFAYSGGLTLLWQERGQWRVVYAPDFEVCNAQPWYDGEAYRFVLDISDLLHEDQQNTIAITNLSTPSLAARVGGDLDLVVGMMRLETRDGRSPTLSADAVMDQPVNRGEPVAGPAQFEWGAFNTGGFEITVDGVRYPFETLVSYPGGGFNRLEASPEPTVEGQGAWSTSLRSGQEPLIVGRGPDYELRRAITVHEDRVEVADTWVNLRNRDLGLIVDNRVMLDGDRRIHIAGSVDPGRSRYYSPGNPSVYVAGEDHGVGMICEDDVYRNQAWLHYDAEENATGLRTEMLWLPQGGEHTLRWSVYPMASNDYFDFINAVRDDWDSNYLTPGPWAFFNPDTVIDMPIEDLRAQLDERGIDYFIYCGGWVDRKANSHTIGFGTYVLDEYWASFRDRLRRAIDKIHEARPGSTCLVYYDTQRDSFPDANERYPDSAITNAEGQHHFTEWSGQYSISWSMLATLENSYGRAMLDAVDDYFEQMGIDGLYWDEMETTGYGAPLVTHLFGDGYSCVIDPETHEVDHQIAVQSIAGADHRVAVVEKVREHGGMVMGNGPTSIRRLLELEVPRMVEQQHNDVWWYEGLLDTPLGYLSSYQSFDRFVRVVNQASLPVATSWMGYEHQVQPYLFPFTPIELHPGYLLGQERIVVSISGDFGWHGERTLARVTHFDTDGMITDRGFATVVGAEAKTQVDLEEGELVVLERLPITITPVEGEVTVSDIVFSDDEVAMTVSSESGATVNIEGIAQMQVGAGEQQVRVSRQAQEE
ncbi:MAG: hypothetical protein GX131_04030 [candidate division WS1 bacterium]|nr:hypothetical protein [candidate division WS1 bacterium]